MAISRPTAAAAATHSIDSTSAAAAMPLYSPNALINSLLAELISHDRDLRLFPAIRDAAANPRLPGLSASSKLPGVLQKLLSRLTHYLEAGGETRICKGFKEVYSVFATDEGRKSFFGEDPPPDRMTTRPTYATPFVTQVKLIHSLKELEQAELPGPASLQWSSIGFLHTLYCHYYLFEFNTDRPIEQHPALAFWLQNVVRYEHIRLQSAGLEGYELAENKLRQEIAYLITRYLAINLAIGPENGYWSPAEFLSDEAGLVYPNGAKDVAFKAAYFVDCLESQGLLRKSWPDLDPEVTSNVLVRLRGGQSSRESKQTIGTMDSDTPLEPPRPALDSVAKPAAILPITPSNFDSILPRLDRADAHQLLVNLPLDIQSMETLNAIFARLQSSPAPDDVLGPLNLDPTIIACGYIQHGLRQLERQRPASSRTPGAQGLHAFGSDAPSASSSAGSSLTSSATATSSGSSSALTDMDASATAIAAAAASTTGTNGEAEAVDQQQQPYAPADDASDTKRKISLLLLFMRNLLRKNHVGFAALQYDIQEICTRYSPIREVRLFRRWIETGEDG